LLAAARARGAQPGDEEALSCREERCEIVRVQLALEEQPHPAVELERPSQPPDPHVVGRRRGGREAPHSSSCTSTRCRPSAAARASVRTALITRPPRPMIRPRSEEHTSELQSRENLVCRLLLKKK